MRKKVFLGMLMVFMVFACTACIQKEPEIPEGIPVDPIHDFDEDPFRKEKTAVACEDVRKRIEFFL